MDNQNIKKSYENRIKLIEQSYKFIYRQQLYQYLLEIRQQVLNFLSLTLPIFKVLTPVSLQVVFKENPIVTCKSYLNNVITVYS